VPVAVVGSPEVGVEAGTTSTPIMSVVIIVDYIKVEFKLYSFNVSHQSKI
jgi:hypothetical protein